MAMVNEENLFKGTDKDDFGNKLSKVSKYRNAFAHGDFVETNEGTVISYFEGKKLEKPLTDEYWEALEKIFVETHEKCTELKAKVIDLIKTSETEGKA